MHFLMVNLYFPLLMNQFNLKFFKWNLYLQGITPSIKYIQLKINQIKQVIFFKKNRKIESLTVRLLK